MKYHAEFIDNKEGNQFTAYITRPIIKEKEEKSVAVSNSTFAVSKKDRARSEAVSNKSTPC